MLSAVAAPARRTFSACRLLFLFASGSSQLACPRGELGSAPSVTGVSLDYERLTLGAGGQAATLVATVEPAGAGNKTVEFATSNAEVATVSSAGEVTPIRVGAAIITVRTIDGGFTDTCRVSVTGEPVTSVSLTPKNVSLRLGGLSVTLEATVEPSTASNKKVAWSSTNATVATVTDAGTVSAVGEGTAVIAATTSDGGFTDTCVVTVTEAGSSVTDVSLDQDTLDLVYGAGGETLAATVAPADATNDSVTWSSSDKSVVTVSDTGVVTATGSGTATVTVRTEEGGHTATCEITVLPDVLPAVNSTTPLTGQAIISWGAPNDPNFAGVRVTMASSDDTAVTLPVQTVPAGQTQVVLSGLSYPTSYTVSLEALGGDDLVADAVEVPVSTVQVTYIVRSTYVEAANSFIWDNTNGSASAADFPGKETYDVVLANSGDASIPANYRWVFFPGLADPTDRELVSMVVESFNDATKAWESNGRFLRVNAAYTRASYNYGQWNAWADPNDADSGTDDHIVHCERDDDTPTFQKEATFRMVAGSRADSVSFQWYADETRRLLHTYYHVMAQAEADIGARFAEDATWFLDSPVTGVLVEPTSIEMAYGSEKQTLAATVSSLDATTDQVTWVSSDEHVVSVSDTGVVTATGSGKATVTVKTKEGGLTATCDVTVIPERPTGIAAKTPLTGQAVLSWDTPADPGFAGVRVTIANTAGNAVIPPPQSLPAGATRVVLSGLSYPSEYTVSLAALGIGGVMSAAVDVPVSTVKVTYIVRSTHREENRFSFIWDDTNGSADRAQFPGLETHDVVLASTDDQGIPNNFRWVFFPGLADAKDPNLVSMVVESYNPGSGAWESTDRYMRVKPEYTRASYNFGQWYAWADPQTAPSGADDHIAHCDRDDDTTTFAQQATFRMVEGSQADSVAFEWYADDSRRLLHTFYHLMAQDSATVGGRFAEDSSWFLDLPQ